MELYTGQLKNEIFHSHTVIRRKKAVKFSTDVLTFDIEVSSGWINQHGNVIRYHKGHSNEYWNSITPVSLCYIWQFSYNEKVYYGRELRDFVRVLEDLPKDIEFIIWVHNLSYEFAFLSGILEVSEIFARAPHKPIKARFKGFKNITFRCSYMLTRLSLASWGEQIGLPKMVGDLDYIKLRTPLTPLTEKELGYCSRDCEVVYHGILTYIEKYQYQEDIPLTQTGTVRKVVKELLCKNNMRYKKFVRSLCPRSANEYKILQRCFAGGYTHANRFHAGETIRGLIEHYDFASSYPTVMACEKYPMAPWIYTANHVLPDEETFKDTAYLMELHLTGLQCQTYNTYIQASKSSGHGFIYDNGRIISADDLTIWVTEQDYLTIRDSYTWDELEVLKVYKSHKEYLPRKFIDYILTLYENKTKLKGVEGEEDLYLQSKQYINSMYGMMVTAIVQSDVTLDGDTWTVAGLTTEYVEKKLADIRNSFWNDSYFLSYSWGVYVTAYARRNLWKCILSVDENCLYSDTDSIFALGHQDFSWYNDEVTLKLEAVCDYYAIDFERTRPVKKNGKKSPLGIFDKEDDCTEFRTLGAKRYVERRAGDGKLHLTVAGINKGAVELLHNNIDNFKDGFNFDKDKKPVHKQLCTYTTEQPVITWPDGYRSTYTHGINLRPTGYNLGITEDYKALIGYFDKTPDELPDAVKNSLRGKFV